MTFIGQTQSKDQTFIVQTQSQRLYLYWVYSVKRLDLYWVDSESKDQIFIGQIQSQKSRPLLGRLRVKRLDFYCADPESKDQTFIGQTQSPKIRKQHTLKVFGSNNTREHKNNDQNRPRSPREVNICLNNNYIYQKLEIVIINITNNHVSTLYIYSQNFF